MVYPTSMQSPWTPVLDPDAATEALSAVRSIAADLRSLPLSLDAGLASGRAGIALLFASLAQTEPDGDHATVARRLLDSAINNLVSSPMGSELYGGFLGVAWAAQHLSSFYPDEDDDEFYQEVDEAVLTLLGNPPALRSFDVFTGLLGLGVYALERLPSPFAQTCLERVVMQLAARAERQADGLTWKSEPDSLPAEVRKEYPNGYYNLGLAHGVPGVLVFLAEVIREDISAAAARDLLRSAAHWLWMQRIPGEAIRFPSLIGEGITPEPARLAWCYGDLGVAVALLAAGRAAGLPAVEEQAREVALSAAGRTPEQARVKDAGLCHGAAGVGHLFNHLFQETGEARFRGSARLWFDRTLAMRASGRGPGGYGAWVPDERGIFTWRDEPGVLVGAAGVGLALHAAASSIAPSWDAMLLLPRGLRISCRRWRGGCS
jgi:lantibiotic modifying enzyme